MAQPLTVFATSTTWSSISHSWCTCIKVCNPGLSKLHSDLPFTLSPAVPKHTNVCFHQNMYSHHRLGLLLGPEAPVMAPNRVDFRSFFPFSFLVFSSHHMSVLTQVPVPFSDGDNANYRP